MGRGGGSLVLKEVIFNKAYFNNTVMVGNTLHKLLENLRQNKNELLVCIKDDKELYGKHLEIWQILARIEFLFNLQLWGIFL